MDWPAYTPARIANLESSLDDVSAIAAEVSERRPRQAGQIICVFMLSPRLPLLDSSQH